MKQFSLKAFGLLALLFAYGWVGAQNTEAATPKANPLEQLSADPAGYDAAKAEWVASHPKEYQDMQSTERNAATTPWGAPENKAAWVAAHPDEYAAIAKQASDNRVRMTRADFNKLDAAHQARTLQDANIVIID